MGLFTEQDEYDDFKVKPKKMNNTVKAILLTLLTIALCFGLGYSLIHYKYIVAVVMFSMVAVLSIELLYRQFKQILDDK